MNLKLVVLRQPYYTMRKDETAIKLFGRLAALRISGYAKHFGNSVIPFGKDDLISDHVALCEEKNGELFPIFTYRFISEEICNKFDLEFPVYHWIKDQPEIYNDLKTMSEKGKKLGTISSFALSPEVYSKYRRQIGVIKEMISATMPAIIEGYEVFNAGATRSLSYKIQENVGFEIYKGASFVASDFDDEFSFLMRFDAPTEYLKEVTNKHKELIDNAIQIAPEEVLRC